MFNKLNDTTSILYTKNLEIQKEYIENKMSQTQLSILTNNSQLIGSVEEISNLCSNTATNIIKNFFRKCPLSGYNSRKCSMCNKTDCTILEKAHSSYSDRPTILKNAIQTLWTDDNVGINAGNIFREFILLHKNTPMFLLCPSCHRKYDKIKVDKNYKNKNKNKKSNQCSRNKYKPTIQYRMSTRNTRNIKWSLRKYST